MQIFSLHIVNILLNRQFFNPQPPTILPPFGVSSVYYSTLNVHMYTLFGSRFIQVILEGTAVNLKKQEVEGFLSFPWTSPPLLDPGSFWERSQHGKK